MLIITQKFTSLSLLEPRNLQSIYQWCAIFQISILVCLFQTPELLSGLGNMKTLNSPDIELGPEHPDAVEVADTSICSKLVPHFN